MKLLVVEDELRLRQLLRRGLMEEGHVVDDCGTGAEASERVRYAEYDAIVLDWGLPDADGVALLKGWRAEGLTTPILLLTARGSSGEKVLGLRAGGDDFLVKPFDFDELLARLEALHRRSASSATASATLGDVQFLRARRQLLGPDGRVVELTSREFQLLSALVARTGDVCTRSELLQQVWGVGFDGDANVVDVYVGYLRSKLSAAGTTAVTIAAVRGSGYRLVVARSADA